MMRKYKLSDVAVVNPKDKLEDLAIRVSFVPMQNVSENGDIDVSQTRLALEVSKGFTSFVDGDVLMAKITPCMENGKGAVATGLCNGRGFGSTEFFVIRPDHTKVRSEWIYYYTTQKQFRLDCEHNMTGSAGQKRVPKAYLENKKIEIPALAEQDDVLAKLGHIKRILTLRQQQLQKLDELVKARFVEMFGDAVANPMNWPVKKLKDLSVQINSGNTPKGGSENYVKDGITFFRSQNVWKDRLEMDDIAYIDVETHESMKRSSLKHGDILMTKTGRINTENSSLGRAALYMGEDDMANVNGHVYFIRLKPEVNNKFVLRILVSPEYRDLIRRVCVGGIDKRQLNKEHIEDFPIICPPSDMIDEYVAFADQVNKSKVAVQRALDETQLLFDSLMQKYFG